MGRSSRSRGRDVSGEHGLGDHAGHFRVANQEHALDACVGQAGLVRSKLVVDLAVRDALGDDRDAIEAALLFSPDQICRMLAAPSS